MVVNVIDFKGIVKHFRRHEVLKGIDITIDRGHRIALVGSNGAGKTTLIRCLLGEYTCQGQVLVDGMNPRVQRAEVLAKVGFVPQLPPPLRMSVGQLIHYAAQLYGSGSVRMIGVASELGFNTGHFKSHPFVKLSGGQKQKLLIAIALGRDSELLIMDEPATNLDPDARHVFFQLLAEKRASTAMLISSHRLDEVASLVNRVIELDQGRIVLDDRVADLVEMASRLRCRVRLIQREEAFTKAIMEWGFIGSQQDTQWDGMVAGPDRLRFLGLLSRYAALLAAIKLDDVDEAEISANED